MNQIDLKGRSFLTLKDDTPEETVYLPEREALGNPETEN